MVGLIMFFLALLCWLGALLLHVVCHYKDMKTERSANKGLVGLTIAIVVMLIAVPCIKIFENEIALVLDFLLRA